MRVYELARNLKKKQAEILAIAQSLKIEVKSGFADLSNKDCDTILQALQNTSTKRSIAISASARQKLNKKREMANEMRKGDILGEKESLTQTTNKSAEIRNTLDEISSTRSTKSLDSAPVSPVKRVRQKVETVAEPPKAQAPVEPPKTTPQPEAEAPKKVAQKPAKKVVNTTAIPLDIKADDFKSISPMPPSEEPKITFHPAEEFDNDDDDEDEFQDNFRYDDEDEEDITRAYLGRRTADSMKQQRRQRDDARDESGQTSRQGGRQNRDNRASVANRGDSRDTRNGRDTRTNNRDNRDNRNQKPDALRGGGMRQSRPPEPAGRKREQPQQQPQKLQQQPQPPQSQQKNVFPTRPQANVFPTRPQANVFPTRPQSNGIQRGISNQPNQRDKQQKQGGRMQQTQGGKDRHQNGNNKGKQQPQNGQPKFAPPAASVQAAPLVGDMTLTLKGPTLVRELAEMMNIRPNKLIADLMQHNQLISINQRVDIDMAGKIAERYGYKVTLERVKRSSERKPAIKRLDEDDDIPEDKPEDMRPRPPVVTFLGHVDHGKTSLLDYIRKTKVAAGEAGGITQHIGAYSVAVNDRKITFLDTPGHAAFSAMRARGAKLTDIAVIVVAADDGIMPQTREVIKECRLANVQIMVAINKCDLPAARPDRVRQQLQAEGLTPEEWGGDIVCCEVSAHTGAGMDNLLEMILLQADVLELQANPNRRADGYVIEAQMEIGRGPTATLLVASGTLKQGDIVLIDNNYGRMRGLVDDRGNKIASVGPAQAVRVMGLSGVPEAGAEFRVMTSEKRAKELAEKFAQERKAQELQEVQKTVSLDNLFSKMKEQEQKHLSIIVKADTQGTVEAICDTLRDIRSSKITLEILSSSIGNVTITDVQRAAAGDAIIVGFQVNQESGVAAHATHEGVRINTFRIIYELFDFVKQSMLDKLDPEYKEVVRGHAQIRQIFDIGKQGKVAGCQLLDGILRVKDSKVRITRKRELIWDGAIASLRHFKEEVNEVGNLQECGIFFDGFEDFLEGDMLECYGMEEMERTL